MEHCEQLSHRMSMGKVQLLPSRKDILRFDAHMDGFLFPIITLQKRLFVHRENSLAFL